MYGMMLNSQPPVLITLGPSPYGTASTPLYVKNAFICLLQQLEKNNFSFNLCQRHRWPTEQYLLGNRQYPE
jgi:hypothetical protein